LNSVKGKLTLPPEADSQLKVS